MIYSTVLIQPTRACDGRTDGQTGGIAVAYTALSIAWRGKNGTEFALKFQSLDNNLYEAVNAV